MMRHVIIAGGTGFIGSALVHVLKTEGFSVTVLTRKQKKNPQEMSWTEVNVKGLPKTATDIINVAGQNVLDLRSRWTPKFREAVWQSRVNTNRILAEAIPNSNVKCFISISGVAYYPPSDTREYTEYDKCEKYDFFSDLVHNWEAASELPSTSNCRKVIIRSGVVLGRKGGIIQQTYWPFFFGLGGPLGDGSQYMPWIHIDDLAELFLFALNEEKVDGILNGVSTQMITNKQFATAFAKSLHRPAIIPQPKFLLDLLFGKERATIVTGSQKIFPKRPLEYGFKYGYSDINDACRQFASLMYTDPY
ncbi:epimerase family protein SDR39U1 [Chelonus insularis]|uniref:epimerase family protein SDR39U1 n=1 Tax=Chelonus insularis TaxID=460826 RepID=UPI00158B6C45|nr:epimerase family protein SDR39U1 [Chelonus insularis]